MTQSIEIKPWRAPLDAAVRPPGSKSLTNRALVCAALARGTSTLRGALASEDTQVMIDALRALGIAIEKECDGQTLVVAGQAGTIPQKFADLYIANSGTTVRFLTALVALGHGIYRLHGTPRMHERPIQDLLDALASIGVDAGSENGTGCPPVMVRAGGIALDRARIRGDVSSQFLTALLLVAPCAGGKADAPVEIAIEGSLVSQPYARMTVAVMAAFGANVSHGDDLARFEISRTGYTARTYEIEPDASAASYFWAAAAIAGGRVRVEGLSRGSLQGDVAFCDCLAKMGCRVTYEPDATTVEGGPLVGIDVDMNAISDTVQTLAAVALFADGPTSIRGVAHIRHKESDRIGALATELRKFGAVVVEQPDGLRIQPRPLKSATIDTYDDHRMAMSLALVGLRVPGVVINDPGCTAKTYPRFFDDLAALGD
ncbi:MAG: 3-phosphoshikimate 1-carboxyvinyltransferase [Pirellulales bacterium]